MPNSWPQTFLFLSSSMVLGVFLFRHHPCSPAVNRHVDKDDEAITLPEIWSHWGLDYLWGTARLRICSYCITVSARIRMISRGRYGRVVFELPLNYIVLRH